jgi:2-amino-4-hydroxy-6-hydroxymethyldihydropteridine diphosphokinase
MLIHDLSPVFARNARAWSIKSMTALAWVFIGIGSNLGDPPEQITRAMQKLATLSQVHPLMSSLWGSRPVDCPVGSPDFVNAVLGLRSDTSWDPATLLTRLQDLEASFGERDRSVVNSPRYLDLDLLLWGAGRFDLPGLVIPHPRARERSFVMQPLAEIVPNLKWPGAELTVSQLAEGLGMNGLWRLGRVDSTGNQ